MSRIVPALRQDLRLDVLEKQMAELEEQHRRLLRLLWLTIVVVIALALCLTIVILLLPEPARAQELRIPSLIEGRGTAGAQVGGVLTIQGDPAGTPIPTAPGPGVIANVNLQQILGVAPSAVNPLPARLSNGAGYIDPRDRNWILSGATDQVDILAHASTTQNNLAATITDAGTVWAVGGTSRQILVINDSSTSSLYVRLGAGPATVADFELKFGEILSGMAEVTQIALITAAGQTAPVRVLVWR